MKPSFRPGGMSPKACFGSIASTLLFSRDWGSSVSNAPNIIRQATPHSSARLLRLLRGKTLAFVISQLSGRQLVLSECDICAIALFIIQLD